MRGGLFLFLVTALVFVPAAAAQDASSAGLPVDEDRARLMRMLKEMELPPAVSYHQAPPPVRAALVLRQHDIEEKPSEN